METEDLAGSSKSANSENGSAGSFNVSLSSISETHKKRSKSLPYIGFDTYTPAELRKIRERLLRYYDFLLFFFVVDRLLTDNFQDKCAHGTGSDKTVH